MAKIVFVCTEDWFFESHFLPLIEAARQAGGNEIMLIANTDAASLRLEKMGIDVLPLKFGRPHTGFFEALRTFYLLNRILRREQPDILHLLSLKPMVFGGITSLLFRRINVVYHLTGMGYLEVRRSGFSSCLRCILLYLITLLVRRRRSWLIVENEDDKRLIGGGKEPFHNITLLGGAGVDPEYYSVAKLPDNPVLSLTFVGRMVWSKGIDILVDACQILIDRGCKIELNLFGDIDVGNPRHIPLSLLSEWSAMEFVRWHGFRRDVREAWKHADIAVFPSRGGEGLPRALLEAAACGRPLVATDVPGCKHFVRDGIEGCLVAPEDPFALAAGLETVIADRELRFRMAKAARSRIFDGYTHNHITSSVAQIYKSAIGESPIAGKLEFS